MQILTCFGYFMKWFPMTALFWDNAASTVLDKNPLWRPWLVFISSWADVKS